MGRSSCGAARAGYFVARDRPPGRLKNDLRMPNRDVAGAPAAAPRSGMPGSVSGVMRMVKTRSWAACGEQMCSRIPVRLGSTLFALRRRHARGLAGLREVRSDVPARADPCWCKVAPDGPLSRDFGAADTGVRIMQNDRSVTAVTGRALLRERRPVARCQTSATEMLKPSALLALRVPGSPLSRPSEPAFSRCASRAIYF